MIYGLGKIPHSPQIFTSPRKHRVLIRRLSWYRGCNHCRPLIGINQPVGRMRFIPLTFPSASTTFRESPSTRGNFALARIRSTTSSWVGRVLGAFCGWRPGVHGLVPGMLSGWRPGVHGLVLGAVCGWRPGVLGLALCIVWGWMPGVLGLVLDRLWYMLFERWRASRLFVSTAVAMVGGYE